MAILLNIKKNSNTEFGNCESVSYHTNGAVAMSETNTRLYRTVSTNNVLVNMQSLSFLPTLGTSSKP